jgi:IS30 family transposase
MCYAHLTRSQRYQIEALKQADVPVDRIAHKLRVHRSTVYRELNRGGRKRQDYVAWYAQEAAERRSLRSAANHPTKPAALWHIVHRLIRLDWSPEEARGYLGRFDHPLVSVPAIYAHLRRQRGQGGVLYEHLRFGRKYRPWGRHGHGAINPDRPSIHSRPASAQLRLAPGHWEGDTFVGGRATTGNPHRLLSLVERYSRYLCLRRPHGKWALSAQIARTTASALRRFPVRSITFDNGSEFSDYPVIAKALGCTVYFADPGHPEQRGTCENTIGLVRQYIPKGTSGSHLTTAQIRTIENKLNNRPRKCLGYKTPAEVFLGAKPPVALRT